MPSEYRDPRVDPRAGDVLRLASGDIEQVLCVDDEIVGQERRAAWLDTSDTLGRERGMSIAVWRDRAQHAVVLWQDGAPPPADVALLASANRTLAEQVERAERERDEARRVLLAIAEDVYGHPYRYTLAMLRRVLGIPPDGVESAAPDVRSALRRLCGVDDG